MRIKISFYCFIVLCLIKCGNVYSQNDSINYFLSLSINDTAKINKIHNYLKDKLNEYDILIKGGKAILKLAELNNWEKGKLYGYYNLGYGLDGNQNFEEAVKNYYLALTIAENRNDDSMQQELYNYLGIIASIQGQHKKSIYLFRKSLNYSQKINNIRAIGILKNNIGIEYNELKQHGLALIYFKESLKLFNQIKRLSKIEVFSNIIETYINLNNIDEAKNYCDSIKHEITLQKYATNLNAKETTFLILGQFNLFANNIPEAISNLNNCIAILEKHPYYDQLKKAYKLKSVAHEKLGQDKDALKYYKLFVSTRDTLMNAERIKNTLEVESKYKNIKTELVLEKNKKDIEIKRLKLKRNNILLLSLSSIVLVLIASLFFVFRLLKLRRNDLRLLKNKNEIIEEKQREILASIRYAKRIQDSFLASEKYINTKLKKLMSK